MFVNSTIKVKFVSSAGVRPVGRPLPGTARGLHAGVEDDDPFVIFSPAVIYQ